MRNNESKPSENYLMAFIMRKMEDNINGNRKKQRKIYRQKRKELD